MRKSMNKYRNSVVFDLETTGLDTYSSRIVSISALSKNSKLNSLVNPGISIPEESSKIHGIYDNDVEDVKVFKQIENKILQYMSKDYIITYNGLRYDLPILCNHSSKIKERMKESYLIDVYVIVKYLKDKKMDGFETLDNLKLVTVYEHVFKRKMRNAHNSMADTSATEKLFKYFVKSYPTIVELFTLTSTNIKDELMDSKSILTFGKHIGKTIGAVRQIDRGYIDFLKSKQICSIK